MPSSQEPVPMAFDLDPSRYLWMQTSDKYRWERLALAGETMWAQRPNEYHQMFLSASLLLISPVNQHVFHTAARESWMRLRSETPDMCVTACISEERVLMQYEALEDQGQTLKWCRETFFIENTVHELGFEAMKDRVTSRKSISGSSQAAVLLVAIDDANELVGRVELMLNVDHQIMDGIGIRILLSKYLSILSKNLSMTEYLHALAKDGEAYVDQLPTKPWICLLNDEQVISGPEYEDAVKWNWTILLEKMPKNLGLPLLQTMEPKSQNLHFITLPEPCSTKILGAIKRLFGPRANITHLAHAAMVVALLRRTFSSRPCQALLDGTALYSPCWINGRRYIRYADSESSPTNTYLPICQSFAPIIFPNLYDLSLSKYADDSETKNVLIKACQIATLQYTAIKQKKSMMPEGVNLMEYLGSKMQQSAKLTSHVPGYVDPSTADPFLLSDGITENYISRQYLQAFKVDEVRFAANAEGPNLIVRLSSWRGQISISGEWRDCDYEKGMIVEFLEDIQHMMCLIASDS